MNDRDRNASQAAVRWVGDAADFLGMGDEERRLLDVRVAVGLAVRRRRRAAGLSQAQLAERIGSGQARVAKVEGSGEGVSLDLMFKALIALGGGLEDLGPSAYLPPDGLPAPAPSRPRADVPPPGPAEAGAARNGIAKRRTAKAKAGEGKASAKPRRKGATSEARKAVKAKGRRRVGA